MDKAVLIRQLSSMTPEAFVENYIFDSIPFMFSGNRQQYIGWKRQLANKIGIDPACLTIIGSASLGVSLNPNKNYKNFDNASDIDVAIISNYHFISSWRFLRSNEILRSTYSQKIRNSLHQHRTNYIYYGTIATDKLLGILPFGRDWLTALGEMKSIEPTNDRDVNIRIYSEYDALRSYQVMSVKKIRDEILSGGV